ncbi:MAG: glutathione peroxidase [Chitinophagaceae bacterium]|nr:glutathione peroxidase [Chitinophagaceae bacterium]MCW5925379.1 glutathione peroxidase [Chitinophagaceae bacterium]
MDSIYQFRVIMLNGDGISLESYRDKTLLIVNTASKCGLTPQYEGLEKLYRKYKDQGLLVLGFPCNQFGNQEPGDAGEIESFCQVNYGVSFPMFARIDVNGKDAHPLFKFLKKKLSGFFGGKIKWNFTKFLVDKNGKPVKRYAPVTTPEKLEADIKRLLDE